MNQTKQVIGETLWQMLEEDSGTKLTIQNLVERCHINRKTFYYYFTDILAVVEYTVNTWSDGLIAHQVEAGSPFDCLGLIAEECTKRKKSCLHLYRFLRQEDFMRLLFKTVNHAVEVYLGQMGKIGDEPQKEEEMMTWLFRCTFGGIILDWLNEDASYDLVGRFQLFLDVYRT